MDNFVKKIQENVEITKIILSNGKKMNPLSLSVLKTLKNEIILTSQQRKTKVIIISSDGPGFSAGHDLDELKKNPESVPSRQYDLIINGYEVAGGSIRIHDSELQRSVFEILGIDKKEAQDRFGFFIDALKYGTPPHGGIAFGFDRLVML